MSAPAESRRRAGLSAAALSAAVLSAAVLAFAAGTAHAQQYTPNYRNADLSQVIEAVGAVTGRNFIVDPRVRTQVTLISNTPMSAEAFYEAFLATLAVNGYMAVDEGEVTKIMPDASARMIATPSAASAGDAIITRVIRLDNISATAVVPVLRPMMQQYGHLAPLQGPNMLVLVDRASNVERLVDIVEAMDRGTDDDIEVIPLDNAFAGEVVRTLQQLTQASQQASGGAPTAQVFADERTNSVLLSGSGAQRVRYRGLIAYLDAPVAGGGDMRVRYLNHANAEDLATRLQAQFTGSSSQPGQSGQQGIAGVPVGAAGTPGAENGSPLEAEGPISIWAHPDTNALVLAAPSRVMQSMMAIIDQIDIPRAQVLVDAIIVEMTAEKAAQFGVSWIIDGSGSDDAIGLTNFGSTTPGVVQLGAAAQSDTPSPAAIPEGITFGIGRIRDAGTSWASLVSALRGDGSSNIISQPQIAVLDNGEAEISVGQEVPFLTGQFTNTGASDGAINPFQTIQREEVGTKLLIAPQINAGDGMRLTIEVEQSNISPGAGGAVDLITNSRRISTEVTAADGEILVLGGLMDDQLRESEQRVPVIGRVPGLGWLFRSRSTERVKTNLMVFIRPRILRDSVQSSRESERKYNFIRGLQQEQLAEPVQLLREETRPLLPEYESNGETILNEGATAPTSPRSGPTSP